MGGRRLRRVAQHLLGCSVSGEEERSRGPRLSSMGKLIDPAEGAATPEMIFAPGGHCDYYGTTGSLDPDPGLRRELLQIPSGPDSPLAVASAPAACDYLERPPALWGAADWAALEARQLAEPLVDMEKVRAAAVLIPPVPAGCELETAVGPRQPESSCLIRSFVWFL